MNVKFEAYKGYIFQYIAYLLLRSICGMINCLPYSVARKTACFTGSLLYYLLSCRRRIALENLRHALSDTYTEKQLRSIAVKSFGNLGLLFIEFIRIPQMVRRGFFKYVTIDRKEIVWQELDKKKGVILLISHYGNWELMAVMAGIIGYPISAVGRPMKNQYIYRYIERIRGYSGLKALQKKGVAKEVIAELRANRVVAILFDQYAGSSGVAVPFFGRPAYTTTAVAQFAIRTGAQVIAAFNTRQPDGTHKIYVEDPITIATDCDRADAVRIATQRYNELLESWIRKHPDHWFWFHRRWKTPRKYQRDA